MKTRTKIVEKIASAALVLLVSTAISPCAAQVMASTAVYREGDPQFRVKNLERPINIAPNVNQNAVGVALNADINSPYEELKPAFAPHGDKLYFSRVFHPANVNGVLDHEDIWYSQFDSLEDTWSEPIRMPGILNNAGPNYINNVSLTGDTLILGNQYGKNGKMHAGLSYTAKINGEWAKPHPINIINDYNISEHASHFVALKHGIIISAIERDGSYGARDLYVSFWNGEFATEPVNMGRVINSDMEESSPFLSCDMKTLYFASKGHSGYGGYDIFMSRRLDDSFTNWTTPRNLGPAVNGPLDDEYFSITHCGRYAVYTKQQDVNNVDLFKISTKELFGKDAPSVLPANMKPKMTMKKL